ncbi:MAG: hypothetical protein K2Y05_05290 [Hyphomicrobiaceae bacterium]|nr:hypothetical protein [Hyphomicrobiaceae bacterium]
MALVALVALAPVAWAPVWAGDAGKAADEKPATADPLFDPVTGYRLQLYRAPVPQQAPPGATMVSLEELTDIVTKRGGVLVDVNPAEGAGADPVTGAWHVPKPRRSMAGSTWLPDVGRGTLTPILDAYFRSNLERLTAGDVNRPLLIYCQAECWQSWNAAKRAVSFGYTAVYWYPDGTDGMRDWDVPLLPVTPVPVNGLR